MNFTKVNPFRSSARIITLIVLGPLLGLAFAVLVQFTNPMGQEPSAVTSDGIPVVVQGEQLGGPWSVKK